MPQKIVKLEKTKLHQSYYNSKGNKVVGATTILSNLGWNRPVLMKWAVNQSIKGIDPFKFTGEAADIGERGDIGDVGSDTTGSDHTATTGPRPGKK